MKLCIVFLFQLSFFTLIAQEQQDSFGSGTINERVVNPVLGNNDRIGTRAFVQVVGSASTFQFGRTFLESCSRTEIGAPFTISNFPGGLVYRNGIVYTWNQNAPFQFWAIDTVTGVHTLIFNLANVPFSNLTGMCWDGTNMYGLANNTTQSQLVIINMSTGVCLPVGLPSPVTKGSVTLIGRSGVQYSLFVLDVYSDSLYKVNKQTGVFTPVGPLGVNINLGQDGSVDPNDQTFYILANSTFYDLRKLDTATGTLGPVLCTYTAQPTGIACIPSILFPPFGTQTSICRTGMNVPINDHGTARDSIQVALGTSIFIHDVNVRITSITHTWDSDLTFYLRKGNVGAVIINKVGGSGDNFINTVLNDSATIPIASGTAPFTGTYIPSSPLAQFNFPSGLGDGYWKLAITDTVTGDTGSLLGWCLIITYTILDGGIQTIEIPNFYFLEQNYPNPFNPVTNIKFGIPETGNVRLVVYDILGREVTTLMNEHKNPGTYEVKFNASQLASGIYFYSLQTERVTETKRMLLIK
jgi:subtilisin-like proprotein convertase family protein